MITLGTVIVRPRTTRAGCRLRGRNRTEKVDRQGSNGEGQGRNYALHCFLLFGCCRHLRVAVWNECACRVSGRPTTPPSSGVSTHWSWLQQRRFKDAREQQRYNYDKFAPSKEGGMALVAVQIQRRRATRAPANAVLPPRAAISEGHGWFPVLPDRPFVGAKVRSALRGKSPSTASRISAGRERRPGSVLCPGI